MRFLLWLRRLFHRPNQATRDLQIAIRDGAPSYIVQHLAAKANR